MRFVLAGSRGLDHERAADQASTCRATNTPGVAHPAEHILAQVEAGLLLDLAERRLDADAAEPAAAGDPLQDAVERPAEVRHAEAEPRVAGQRQRARRRRCRRSSPTSACRG